MNWSLPHASTRRSTSATPWPDDSSSRNSTPLSRKGWLQHLRSCISRLWSFFQPPDAAPAPASLASLSSSVRSWLWRSRSRLYHQRWHGASGQRIFVSIFGGRRCSTSCFTRRFMSTAIISFARRSCDPSPAAPPPRSKAASKAALSGKTSGKRKFSSAQSSWRSFWSGVPVSRSARSQWSFRTALEMSESSFLMMWPSSRTT
mmetsp:Transcript_20670/g.68297  ORF Transcript_20670/g.68297 Transcript_20670/m.68297 type:complete len:203 (-) Transcript_20670:313-921(-)